MTYLFLLALLLAAFFFYKGVRAGAYGDDRTIAGDPGHDGRESVQGGG